MQKERFEQAKETVLSAPHLRRGIGTLSEKTVHAILKNYYAPDPDMHEIPVKNYVADIYTGTQIIEIQTRQFYKMRDKLTAFLSFCPVTIVYPIPRQKWLVWVDGSSGELAKPRKSPVKGNIYQVFLELYRIKMFLKDPNLRIHLILMDIEEYRLLDGYGMNKKRGSTKFDRIPLCLAGETRIEEKRDYLQFIPNELKEEFTVKDFAGAACIRPQLAQVVLHLLHYMETVERVGKKGNAWIYRVIQ